VTSTTHFCGQQVRTAHLNGQDRRDSECPSWNYDLFRVKPHGLIAELNVNGLLSRVVIKYRKETSTWQSDTVVLPCITGMSITTPADAVEVVAGTARPCAARCRRPDMSGSLTGRRATPSADIRGEQLGHIVGVLQGSG
jgi:hypothetical protein